VRGGGSSDCLSLKGARWGKEGGPGSQHRVEEGVGGGTRQHGRDAWRRGPGADGAWPGGCYSRPSVTGVGRVAWRMGLEEEGGSGRMGRDR
jgi:hypothetical protein